MARVRGGDEHGERPDAAAARDSPSDDPREEHEAHQWGRGRGSTRLAQRHREWPPEQRALIIAHLRLGWGGVCVARWGPAACAPAGMTTAHRGGEERGAQAQQTSHLYAPRQ